MTLIATFFPVILFVPKNTDPQAPLKLHVRKNKKKKKK